MIYFDNAATTQVSKEVINDIISGLTRFWGNPSSPYETGRQCKNVIEHAREQIASTINASPEEIIFTSGGTEANNMVIYGACKPHLFTPATEHHSVLKSFYHKELLSLEYIPVDRNGVIDLEQYKSLSFSNHLVSVAMVNNETGTIQDIKKLAEIAHNGGGLFHTDAVQAYSHQLIDVKDLDIDFMSVSGHKWGCPKGIGFLYIKKGMQLSPLICGGSQESNLRAGTENTAYIYAMGKQAKRVIKNQPVDECFFAELRNYFVYLLNNASFEAKINCDLNCTQPNILNFRIEGIDAQQLVSLLDEREVCVGTGSACSSGENKPSHVLKAIGLSDEEAESSIRISFAHCNTKEELFHFITRLERCVQILQTIK